MTNTPKEKRQNRNPAWGSREPRGSTGLSRGAKVGERRSTRPFGEACPHYTGIGGPSGRSGEILRRNRLRGKTFGAKASPAEVPVSFGKRSLG
ncbi:hypothetical protein HMPREF9440_00494 [Sutterella parvirubra YIT 11816]|uniref:Uncharacterized protein n=1 Tax=Sutterella parvirubra YIT 11816 TaxID=762967 RepID=H3KCP0_9BURK|nr:hypothetical protein HMPREF9440_00494 [Sutterella parvirubra YIT 11816]